MANTFNLGNGNWAQKTEKLLAYNAENDNYKPLPFDFDRGSTATVVNKDGLIETVGTDEPRIDFLNNTKGHLLLEPQRTNKIAYSENLNGAGWLVFSADGGSAVRTLNYGISPSGEQNSTRVVFTTEFTSLYYSFSGISGDASASMYVKGTAGEVIGFGFGTDVSFGQEFTLNGQWQRIEFNAVSTNTTLNINSWGSTRNAYDIEVYGVQLEAGSYATSYIPTSGSTATRSADDISLTFPDTSSFNSSGSVSVLFDIQGRELTGSNSTGNNLSFEFGSNNRIVYNQNGSNYHRIEINSAGSASYYTTSKLTTDSVKMGITVTSTTVVIYVNGTQEYSETLPSTGDYTTLSSVDAAITEAIGNVKIKDLRFYNTPLTNTELQALTTI